MRESKLWSHSTYIQYSRTVRNEKQNFHNPSISSIQSIKEGIRKDSESACFIDHDPFAKDTFEADSIIFINTLLAKSETL